MPEDQEHPWKALAVWIMRGITLPMLLGAMFGAGTMAIGWSRALDRLASVERGIAEIRAEQEAAQERADSRQQQTIAYVDRAADTGREARAVLENRLRAQENTAAAYAAQAAAILDRLSEIRDEIRDMRDQKGIRR